MDDNIMHTDIVAALAEVRGEIRGLRETTELHITQQSDLIKQDTAFRTQEHAQFRERLDNHLARIDQLESLKDRLWGGAAVVGLISGSAVGVVMRLLGA